MSNLEQLESTEPKSQPALSFQFEPSDLAIFKNLDATPDNVSKTGNSDTQFRLDFCDPFRNSDGFADAKIRIAVDKNNPNSNADKPCTAWELPGDSPLRQELDDKTKTSNAVRLKTGDTASFDGKTTTVTMPSGETLVVDGYNWSLKDYEGKELANEQTRSAAGEKLEDGGYLDHIVPFRGPGWWTINYPNGDSLSIKDGKVTINRAGEKAEVLTPTSSPALRNPHLPWKKDYKPTDGMGIMFIPPYIDSDKK